MSDLLGDGERREILQDDLSHNRLQALAVKAVNTIDALRVERHRYREAIQMVIKTLEATDRAIFCTNKEQPVVAFLRTALKEGSP